LAVGKKRKAGLTIEVLQKRIKNKNDQLTIGSWQKLESTANNWKYYRKEQKNKKP